MLGLLPIVAHELRVCQDNSFAGRGGSLPPSRPSSMVCAEAVNALVRSSIDAPAVLLELLQRFDRLALIASSIRKPVDGSRKGSEGV